MLKKALTNLPCDDIYLHAYVYILVLVLFSKSFFLVFLKIGPFIFIKKYVLF